MDKSPLNFKIQKLDGTVIDMHQNNLFVSTFRISSPDPDHDTETVDGRHGLIKLDTTLNEREINTTIVVEKDNYKEFDVFRDELFKMFDPLEDFYIIRDIQPTKRMRVSISSKYDLEYVWLELGELPLELTIDSGFLESNYTTLSVPGDEIFQFKNGLWDGFEPEAKYEFSTSEFVVWNDSDVPLNPRNMELSIKFIGASSNLKIENKTTGDVFEHKGTTRAGDILEIKGIRHLKNGVSVFRNTNKRLISLAKGWNNFKVTGATGDFRILIDCRFYYY